MEFAINFWAVLAAAASAMVVGSLWYGPLFGKQWTKLAGFTQADMAKAKAKATGMGKTYFVAMVSAVVTAYVLAHFADAFGVFDANSALQLAFWTWLGFIATTQLGDVLWGSKPWKLWFLNASQSLVSLCIGSLILAYWR